MTLEKNQEQLWDELRRFYDENEQVIERSLALDAEKMARDEKASGLDMAVDTFMETANVVMEGLVALGNVHPILGGAYNLHNDIWTLIRYKCSVAIFAFHGIIKLDIARRDNNRKVLAVKLQMQNMMCAMFQCVYLYHSESVQRLQSMDFQTPQIKTHSCGREGERTGKNGTPTTCCSHGG